MSSHSDVGFDLIELKEQTFTLHITFKMYIHRRSGKCYTPTLMLLSLHYFRAIAIRSLLYRFWHLVLFMDSHVLHNTNKTKSSNQILKQFISLIAQSSRWWCIIVCFVYLRILFSNFAFEWSFSDQFTLAYFVFTVVPHTYSNNTNHDYSQRIILRSAISV